MRACSRFYTALVLLFVLCTAAAQAPQTAPPTSLPVGSATVTQLKGDVVLHGTQGEVLTAQPGMILVAETTIETDKGNVLLELQDGSQVLVKPHSRVVLKSPDQGKGYFFELFLGKVVNKIQKRLGSTPSFRMGTPTAVITVRGTRFEVEVTRKLRTYVTVYEGIVEVAGFMGTGPPVLLRPGYFTGVDRDREPTQPHEIGELGEGGGSALGGRGGDSGQGEREGQQSGQRQGKGDSGGHQGPDD
jgi:ferric-dicitrate binding protein FerR (iron transport regulator)